MCLKHLIFAFVLAFSSCVEKSPKDYLHEATALEDQGKLREAIAVFNKAIEKDPKYLPAYINRGADESRLGNYTAAIQNYSIVLKLAPGNILALVNRGRDENNLGQYAAALKDLQSALDCKGGGPVYFDTSDDYDCPVDEILLERGCAYYNLDSLIKAYFDFKFCITKRYQLDIDYLFLGCIYLKSGKKDLACQVLRQSASLGNTDAIGDIKKFCQ